MELGVCYYPEQWPEALWADDARRMVELGIRKVRIGEFAWSRIEPRPGDLQWAWLDRAVDTLHAAGLGIVMGTPTATPPKWLVDKHAGMLAVDAQGRERRFGSRRHYDFSSDVYLEEARRIVTLVAQRYGRHPGVVAWQTDNEYGCHDTVLSHSANAARRFRLWLQQRYGSVQALNQAWGNVFWSQEVGSFDEVDLPHLTVTEANPALRLDHRRFASDEVLRFNRMQVQILREHSPGRPVTHNFMLFFTEFDHYAVAADLDFVGWDSYPLGALEMFWFDEATKRAWLRTGHPDFAAFHHDLYRGMSRQPFWVMEQQPGPVNWAHWNPAPRDGMVRLWTWEAFAHGADVVSYFRWRQAPFGQEQMHAGLNTPDNRLDAGGREAQQVAQELQRVPAVAPQRAAVALVFDYPACWQVQVQPQGADFHVLRLAFEYYSALRSLGLDVDIVPAGASLEGYALVVVPCLPIVEADLVTALQASAAQIVLGPRCGSKQPGLSVAQGLPPGPLRPLMPLRVWRVESLRPGVEEIVSWGAHSGRCVRWREHVELGEAAHSEAHFADGSAAVVRSGAVRYLAGVFDEPTTRGVFERAATEAGLAPTLLPDGLRLRQRGEQVYFFNYSDLPMALDTEFAQWLVGGAVVPPQGVSIARMATA
jgi:beta-galactosidase